MKSLIWFLTIFASTASFSMAEKLDIQVLFAPDGLNIANRIELPDGYQRISIRGYTSNLNRDGMIACLLSGEYPQTNGFLGRGSRLYAERFQWVHTLKQEGYRVFLDSDSAFWSSDHVLKELDVSRGGVDSGTKENEAPAFLLVDIAERVTDIDRINQTLSDALTIVIERKHPLDIETNFHFIMPSGYQLSKEQPYPQLVDVAPNVCSLLGFSVDAFLHGKVWDGSSGNARDCHYFRNWDHLLEAGTPAFFGIRTQADELRFCYGIDFMERGSVAEDYEDFLTQVRKNQTPAQWEYRKISDEGISRNKIDEVSVQSRVEMLKGKMWQIRLETGEGDRNFPHIEDIIYAELGE